MNVKSFKQVTNNTQKLTVQFLRKLVEKAFITFLVLLLFGGMIASLLFYRYVFVAKKAEFSPEEFSGLKTKFQEKTFQQILNELQERSEKFHQSPIESSRDIFQPR